MNRKAARQEKTELKSIMPEREVSAILRKQYNDAMLQNPGDPGWCHPFYEPILKGRELSNSHWRHAIHVKAGRVTYSEWQGQLRIIDTCGWKVGTTSWIFLHRADPTSEVILEGGWTIVGARFRGRTYWMAYDADHRIGETVMTDGSIGPASSELEVRDLILRNLSSAGLQWEQAEKIAQGRQIVVSTPSEAGFIVGAEGVIDLRNLPDEQAVQLFTSFLRGNQAIDDA